MSSPRKWTLKSNCAVTASLHTRGAEERKRICLRTIATSTAANWNSMTPRATCCRCVRKVMPLVLDVFAYDAVGLVQPIAIEAVQARIANAPGNDPIIVGVARLGSTPLRPRPAACRAGGQ